MSERLYFAYGSNINLEQMKNRCPDAAPLTPVILRDYELSFRGFGGVATILPKAGAKVHGLLWDLTPACEISLDHYEGFPRLYVKKSVVVVNEKNNTGYRVMAYVMTPECAKEAQEPPPGYFNGILQGFRQNGIPVHPLYNALQNTRNEVSGQQSRARKDFMQMNFMPLRDKRKGCGPKPKHKRKGR